MSGYGLREQWEAGHSLRHERLWRDDVLLHQLTMNGSLLLAENHDPLWRSLLAASMAQSPEIEWPRLRGLLRLLPAHLARRALWRASQRWWLLQLAADTNAKAFALRHGILGDWLDTPLAQARTRRLERAGEQLEELEWCSADEVSKQAIAVATLRDAHRHARLVRLGGRRQNAQVPSEHGLASIR